ncbi:MAG: iron ABC transporter permease [Eubacteriales bacterium]|nr:iron ABC transporter permease [Eubacteriales bacterium]
MASEKKRFSLVLLISAGVLVTALLLSLALGAVKITPGQMWQALIGNGEESVRTILLQVRLPRTVGAALAGGALAFAGCVIQTVMGNPLASPNVIGVNAGASFFVVLLSALLPAVSSQWLPAAAFFGALLTLLLIWLIARKTGASRVTLVLAGVAVSGIFSAGVDALITLFPDVLVGASAFRIGGFAGLTFRKLWPAWLYMLAAAGLVFSLGSEMDLLTLGEETARSLGVPVSVVRFALLAAAAALAGAAVSFAGLIGFVGLIVPHMARRFAGTGSRRQAVVSLLLGAGLVTLCDGLARVLFAPYELPVGIVLSFLGGPFFLWILMRQRRRV